MSSAYESLPYSARPAYFAHGKDPVKRDDQGRPKRGRVLLYEEPSHLALRGRGDQLTDFTNQLVQSVNARKRQDVRVHRTLSPRKLKARGMAAIRLTRHFPFRFTAYVETIVTKHGVDLHVENRRYVYTQLSLLWVIAFAVLTLVSAVVAWQICSSPEYVGLRPFAPWVAAGFVLYSGFWDKKPVRPEADRESHALLSTVMNAIQEAQQAAAGGSGVPFL